MTKKAYDLYIKDVSGKETGFMLAKNEKGKKMWRVGEAPPLSPRYSVGAVGYEQFPPEQELVWAQDDWSGGFGEYVYKAGSNRYFESYNCDCRYSNQIILGPKVHATGDSGGAAIGTADGTKYNPFAQFRTDFYYATKDGDDRDVWKWDTTNQYWTQVHTVSAAGTSNGGLTVFHDWMLRWLSTTYYYTLNGTSYTEVTGADQFSAACVVKDQLWRGQYPSSQAGVRSCTDPTAWGNWSSTTEIGDAERDIPNMFGLDDVLYIVKEEGLWSIDADGVTANLMPELRQLAGWDNGRGVVVNKRAAYICLKHGLIYQLSAGILLNISPQLFLPHSAFLLYTQNVGPWANSLAADLDYIYAIYLQYADSTYYAWVLAGRQELYSNLPFVWHPICRTSISATNCYAAINTTVSSQTYDNARLFLTEGGGAVGKPCYLKLARGHMNPVFDTGCDYTTTGYILTGWWDASLVDVEKAFLYLILDATNLTSVRYINVYYETDDAGTWTWLGRADIDGKTTLSFPATQVGDEIREPTGRKIRLKIELTTDSSSETPILKSFSLHSIPSFTAKRQFTFAIQCSDSITLNNPSTDRQGAAQIRDDLWGYRKEVWPVTLTDVDGVEWLVKLQAPVEEDYIAEPESREAERIIYVSAIEAVAS